MQRAIENNKILIYAFILAIPVFILVISAMFGLKTDASVLYSGITYGDSRKLIEAEPTIEGNFGVTAQALGTRAALDIWQGHLPLWNHYEGLGTPLLGEMQSAALFPPTWLMLFPHGQNLEQLFLQFVAGLGAFLFFRTFGVQLQAAIVGGMFFELNGVYSWLRNAIFNPVAFLPWLFLAIEWNWVTARSERPLRERLPKIAIGGCIAALSLYAGFPEQVYLYGLLLLAWAMFRAVNMSSRQIVRYVTDLSLTGLIALLLSAPLLVAFADYLGVAELGGHTADGFGGVWLGPSGIVQYIMPYIYGPIFGSKDPIVADIWGSTGGYIGFVPIILSIASLITPERRAVKLFLLAWIAMALGVTHGCPGVYQLFTMIPLTKAAAVFRYLNVSWIFCFLFLSILYVDDVSEKTKQSQRRTLLVALSAGIVCLITSIGAAWPLILNLLAANGYKSFYFILSFAGVLVMSATICIAAVMQRREQSVTILSATLILEALTWFAYPYLSYPRAGKLDLGLVSYLRANAGYQRILNSQEAGLTPNYGSYFGVSLLNYDDLPSPKLTARYIKEKLDPYATSIAYGPFPDGLTAEQLVDWRKLFRARLPLYARTGVEFVLAGANFELVPPFDLENGVEASGEYPIAAGQRLELTGHAAISAPVSLSAVSILIQSTDGGASGHVRLWLCVSGTCAAGQADLSFLKTNRRLSIALEHRVDVHPGDDYTISISRNDGAGVAALSMYTLAKPETAPRVVGSLDVPSGQAPDVRFVDDNVKLAYRGQLFDVYQIQKTRPYFSADGCDLKPVSRDSLEAFCLKPSRLTRLELTMEGWSAYINGTASKIATDDDIFQIIDLPAGTMRVEFSYEPRQFRPALIAAGLTLAILIAIFAKLAYDNVSIFGYGSRNRSAENI